MLFCARGNAFCESAAVICMSPCTSDFALYFLCLKLTFKKLTEESGIN